VSKTCGWVAYQTVTTVVHCGAVATARVVITKPKTTTNIQPAGTEEYYCTTHLMRGMRVMVDAVVFARTKVELIPYTARPAKGERGQ
jgi:hypothetical protein